MTKVIEVQQDTKGLSSAEQSKKGRYILNRDYYLLELEEKILACQDLATRTRLVAEYVRYGGRLNHDGNPIRKGDPIRSSTIISQQSNPLGTVIEAIYGRRAQNIAARNKREADEDADWERNRAYAQKNGQRPRIFDARPSEIRRQARTAGSIWTGIAIGGAALYLIRSLIFGGDDRAGNIATMTPPPIIPSGAPTVIIPTPQSSIHCYGQGAELPGGGSNDRFYDLAYAEKWLADPTHSNTPPSNAIDGIVYIYLSNNNNTPKRDGLLATCTTQLCESPNGIDPSAGQKLADNQVACTGESQ